jgi:hypothetical protein
MSELKVCPFVSFRFVSFRFVSFRVVSCRVVSCRVVSVVSCRVVSCRVVSCRVVSCRVVPCRVVLYSLVFLGIQGNSLVCLGMRRAVPCRTCHVVSGDSYRAVSYRIVSSPNPSHPIPCITPNPMPSYTPYYWPALPAMLISIFPNISRLSAVLTTPYHLRLCFTLFNLISNSSAACPFSTTLSQTNGVAARAH